MALTSCMNSGSWLDLLSAAEEVEGQELEQRVLVLEGHYGEILQCVHRKV